MPFTFIYTDPCCSLQTYPLNCWHWHFPMLHHTRGSVILLTLNHVVATCVDYTVDTDISPCCVIQMCWLHCWHWPCCRDMCRLHCWHWQCPMLHHTDVPVTLLTLTMLQSHVSVTLLNWHCSVLQPTDVSVILLTLTLTYLAFYKWSRSWELVDAEIKVPSDENAELKCSPFKTFTIGHPPCWMQVPVLSACRI